VHDGAGKATVFHLPPCFSPWHISCTYLPYFFRVTENGNIMDCVGQRHADSHYWIRCIRFIVRIRACVCVYMLVQNNQVPYIFQHRMPAHSKVPGCGSYQHDKLQAHRQNTPLLLGLVESDQCVDLSIAPPGIRKNKENKRGLVSRILVQSFSAHHSRVLLF
jgi:hypothetical protein